MSEATGQAGGGSAAIQPQRGSWAGRGRPVVVPVGKLFDKEPPRSIEAEMALLGAMILDPRVIGDVLVVIKSPTDFYDERHAAIYRAVVELYDRKLGDRLDVVAVADTLRDRGLLEQVGGLSYIGELVQGVPTAVTAPHYAAIVAEKARLRRLIDAAGRILYDAYHVGDAGPDGARDVIEKAEMAVFEIAKESDTSDPQRLKDLLDQEMKRLEAAEFDGTDMTGLRTGFADLDNLLRGLQKGEMIVIAARPSMGKTALALNLAEQVAFRGLVPEQRRPGDTEGLIPVLIFSMEMSRSAVVQRLLSAAAGVNSQKIRTGHGLSRDEYKRLMLAAEDLKEAPIHIDDSPDMTIVQLRSRARRMRDRYGIQMVVIDYLQLITAPGAGRESRQVEVSAISRGVKALARELEVPVVVLSQLNRASEQREGNRPRMSDLRESGSIEQDADVVMLLHREDYYHRHDPKWAEDPENQDKIGVAEVIVAKQRNGPTGSVRLVWDQDVTRFRNHAGHRPPVGFDEPVFDGGPAEDLPRRSTLDEPGDDAAPF